MQETTSSLGLVNSLTLRHSARTAVAAMTDRFWSLNHRSVSHVLTLEISIELKTDIFSKNQKEPDGHSE